MVRGGGGGGAGAGTGAAAAAPPSSPPDAPAPAPAPSHPQARVKLGTFFAKALQRSEFLPLLTLTGEPSSPTARFRSDLTSAQTHALLRAFIENNSANAAPAPAY